MNIPRRARSLNALLALTVLAPLFGCAGQQRSSAAGPIRVLVITATQGFRHTEGINASIERLKAVEPTSGMQFDFTEDPGTLNAANLAKYDVLFINNATLRIAIPANSDSAARQVAHWPKTGEIAGALTRDQLDAITSFVRNGKGLVAVHSATDALYGSADYREMVGGGLFRAHPFTREARVIIEDPKNPAVAHMAPSVMFKEEYYYLDVNPRPTSHVLAHLDLTSVNDTTRTDHPSTFLRRYGKGRVYVNLLGHFGETWRRDDYLTGILQGIRIAAGTIPADFSTAP
jgi:type 1 glutamine amidotransferase